MPELLALVESYGNKFENLMITMHTYTRMTSMVCVPQFYDVEGPTTPPFPMHCYEPSKVPRKKSGVSGLTAVVRFRVGFVFFHGEKEKGRRG